MRFGALGITLLLALGACSGPGPKKKTDDPPAPPTGLPVHRLYDGDPRPMEETAVLLIITPTGREGLSLVGRIASEEHGVDFRADPEQALAEVLPGRYRLELYFWIGKSQMAETPGGGRRLKIRSLRSAEKVDATVRLKAGETYFIDPELQRTRYLPERSRGNYFPLVYSESVGLDKRSPPDHLEKTDEFVWRPHLKRLEADEAAVYRNDR